MKKRFYEQTFLLISVTKWVSLATAVGIIVGASTALFLKLLNWASSVALEYPLYYIFLPATFLAGTLLIKNLAPDAEGHGTEKVIEAVHNAAVGSALP
ncbi:MAG: hypothetical protein ACUVTZ_12990 [Armatimonadota bacterium]